MLAAVHLTTPTTTFTNYTTTTFTNYMTTITTFTNYTKTTTTNYTLFISPRSYSMTLAQILYCMKI